MCGTKIQIEQKPWTIKGIVNIYHDNLKPALNKDFASHHFNLKGLFEDSY